MAILPSQEYDPRDTYYFDDIEDDDDRYDTLSGDVPQNKRNMYGVYPTRTWRLNQKTGRITDSIDDEEALEQFAMKALRTARNRYMIYNDQYGTDIYEFIGQDNSRLLAMSELPRLIRETLIYDDRINAVKVENLEYIDSDAVRADVLLDTVYGGKEVNVLL